MRKFHTVSLVPPCFATLQPSNPDVERYCFDASPWQILLLVMMLLMDDDGDDDDDGSGIHDDDDDGDGL